MSSFYGRGDECSRAGQLNACVAADRFMAVAKIVERDLEKERLAEEALEQAEESLEDLR